MTPPFVTDLAPRLSFGQQSELQSILGDCPGELGFQDLLNFARRLQSQDRPELALELYCWLIAEAGASEAIQDQARREAEALQGKGDFGARAEVLLRQVVTEATDARVILPMLGASVVGSLGQAFAMGRLASASAGLLTRGVGARLLAAGAGFAMEGLAFAGFGKIGSEGSGSWGADLARSYLGLGALKFSGGLGRVGGLHGPVLPQLAMFSGLYLAHQLETKLGLRAETNSDHLVADTIAALISLQAGAHLGRRLLGSGFAAFDRELQIRSELGAKPRLDFPSGAGKLAEPAFAAAVPGNLRALGVSRESSLAATLAQPIQMSGPPTAPPNPVHPKSLGERAAALGMKPIPAGKFRMGAEDLADFGSAPVREVHVSDFLLDPFLVTNACFDQYLRENRRQPDALFLESAGRHFILARGEIGFGTVENEREFRATGIELIHEIDRLHQRQDRSFRNAMEVFRDWCEDRGAFGAIAKVLKGESPPLAQFRWYELAQRLFVVRLVPERRTELKDPDPEYPVERVSWYDAVGFADAESLRLRDKHPWMAREGWFVRLPWEAEWEKAARGPRGLEYATSTGELFDWGGRPLAQINQGHPVRSLARVGSYPPNDYGLYDMTGNANEWVGDWAQETYQGLPDRDPKGPSFGLWKVIRGAYWNAPVRTYLRVASRGMFSPSQAAHFVGFRTAASVQEF